MTELRPADGRDQPRPGLPGRGRPGGHPRRGGRRDPRRAQPVRPAGRRAGAARGRCRSPAPPLRPRAGPGHRGAGDVRRDRGARRRPARARRRRATRCWCSTPRTTRTRRSSRLAGGRVRPIALAPPDWRLDEAALQRAVTPATRLLLLNTPHNPTGRVLDEAELELLARAVPRPRPDRRDGRGLRAPGLRRSPRAAGHAARHVGAHAHGLVARQDPLADRLEGGLGDRSGRRSSSACGP